MLFKIVVVELAVLRVGRCLSLAISGRLRRAAVVDSGRTGHVVGSDHERSRQAWETSFVADRDLASMVGICGGSVFLAGNVFGRNILVASHVDGDSQPEVVVRKTVI